MAKRGLPVVLLALALLAAGCGGGEGAATAEAVIETISAADASALLASAPTGLVVLDVRTPEEFASGHLAGAVGLDFYAATFADDLAALDREAPYLLYCRSDNRSGQVREMMRSLGFRRVHEIDGGIVAWAEAGLPIQTP
ncbi:MAG: rhodanese-like domain-containing protein [Acidimicrobiia bacterium]|nr:rhodanese-like domain-containing protein [Acidimicrobiia bacterium]